MPNRLPTPRRSRPSPTSEYYAGGVPSHGCTSSQGAPRSNHRSEPGSGRANIAEALRARGPQSVVVFARDGDLLRAFRAELAALAGPVIAVIPEAAMFKPASVVALIAARSAHSPRLARICQHGRESTAPRAAIEANAGRVVPAIEIRPVSGAVRCPPRDLSAPEARRPRHTSRFRAAARPLPLPRCRRTGDGKAAVAARRDPRTSSARAPDRRQLQIAPGALIPAIPGFATNPRRRARDRLRFSALGGPEESVGAGSTRVRRARGSFRPGERRHHRR